MGTTMSRMTTQRKVILEELRKVRSHPTAEEVYRMVRTKLPRISLGTVYRNLETMSEAGLIKRLDMAGNQRRYDGDCTPHVHVRCTRCGKMADSESIAGTGPGGEADIVPAEVEGFRITAVKILYEGVCPVCWRRGEGARQDETGA